MAEGITWYFELVDKTTAPAKAMTGTLTGVSDAFKQTDASASKTSGGVESSLSTMAVAAGTFLGDIAMKVLDLAENFASLTVNLGIAGLKFAADSADFKRNTLFGLQSMLGAGGDARQTLAELETWAKETGLAKDDFTKLATRALGAGFGKDELKPILAAVSDVRARMGGDAAAGEAFFAALQSMKDNAKKGINPRELAQLGSLGISPDQIYGVIAAQKNITIAQAKALTEGGGVKGQDALVAVLKTVQGMNAGGKLGAIGQEFQAGSLTAQIQHVKDAFGDMFENVNMKPVTDFLDRLNTGLSGGGADKIAKFITDAFGGLAGTLSKISLDDVIHGFETVANVLQAVWSFGVAVVTVAKAWGTSFGEAFGTFTPAMTKLGAFFTGADGKSSIDWVATMTDTFKFLGQVAGASLGFTVVVLETFALAFVKTGQGIKVAFEWIVGEFRKAEALGSELVNGIWTGISQGWASMMAKFHELLGLLPAAARKILGIQSPSKVFAELGMQTGAGFSVGLDSSDMPGQITAALQPPSLPAMPSFPPLGVSASPTLSSLAGGGSFAASRSAPVIELHIHVDGHGGDEALAHQIAEQTERVALPALIHALEQLQMETGA